MLTIKNIIRNLRSHIPYLPIPHIVFKLLYMVFPNHEGYLLYLRKWAQRTTPRYKTITYKGLRLYVNLSDPHLANLYYNSSPEEAELDVIRNLKETDVLIDAGANIGTYALSAPCTVYSFEPSYRSYEIAKRNIALNNRLNIRLFNAALSDQNGTSTLFITQASGLSSLHTNREARAVRTEEVPTLTIDSFVEEHHIHPTFIKMDVEGYEPQVLRGAQRTIERYRPTIMAELFQGQEVRKEIESLGYYDTYAINRDTRQLEALLPGHTPSWRTVNFLFVPKSTL